LLICVRVEHHLWLSFFICQAKYDNSIVKLQSKG
jgi:hypothetical protein